MPRALIERFRKVRERPGAGIGECFDARDTEQRDRPVLLKLLPRLHDDEEVERFEAVAQSLEPLKHSAIVPVLHWGLDGDRPFIVTAPPEGKTLRAFIEDHNANLRWPDLAEVRTIFDGACAAVGVAHRMRAIAGEPVLHGMLSPDCVWITRAGNGWNATVMDFGIASLPRVTWHAETASLIGDPRAPEQLAETPTATPASDVFALGALLVTVLIPFAFSVRPPAWGYFVETHADDVRNLISSMRGGIHPSLLDEIVRALSRDPEARHADADRLRTALRRVTWEPVAEPKPPPRPSELVSSVIVDEVSAPAMRLPSALMADLGPSPMHLRATAPAPRAVTPEPPPAPEPLVTTEPSVARDDDDDVDPTIAGPIDLATDNENTLPSSDAIEALKKYRALARAQSATVITPPPKRGPPRPKVPAEALAPARPRTLPPSQPQSPPPTSIPSGDLFDEAHTEPSPLDADRTLSEADDSASDYTRSPAWNGPTELKSPVEKTHIGKAPPPASRSSISPVEKTRIAPHPARPAPLDAPLLDSPMTLPISASKAPPVAPAAPLWAERTQSLALPPRAERRAPPPALETPPPAPSNALRSPTVIALAVVAAVSLITLATMLLR